MPHYSAPYIHSGDPAYAPPVLRAPSPSSSIGTEYEQDATTIDEYQLSDYDLLEKLKLTDSRDEERVANQDPLLPKPGSPEEETVLFIEVMTRLRQAVQSLRENDLFEQRVLRGSIVTSQEQSSSGDIDSIMRSMMNLSSSPSAPSAPATATTMQPPPTPSKGRFAVADLSFGEPISMGPPPLPNASFFGLGMSDNAHAPMTSTPGRRSTRLKVNPRRP